MLTPSFVRARLTSAVGPDASASKPGIQGCAQIPEKSGLAALPGAPCPNAGAAVTATNAAAVATVLSPIVVSQVRLGNVTLVLRSLIPCSVEAQSRSGGAGEDDNPTGCP